jgi:hypothetical protein
LPGSAQRFSDGRLVTPCVTHLRQDAKVTTLTRRGPWFMTPGQRLAEDAGFEPARACVAPGLGDARAWHDRSLSG